MSTRLFVHIEDDALVGWMATKPGAPLSGPIALAAGSEPPTADEVVVLVPAERCLIRRASPPSRGRAEWLRGLAFQFEDGCAGDVEAMHFCYTDDGAGSGWVVAAESALIEGWLQRAEAVGLDPDGLVPDALLLPTDPPNNALAVPDKLLFRLGDGPVGAVERELWPTLLAAVGGVDQLQLSHSGGPDVAGFRGDTVGPSVPFLARQYQPSLPNLRSGSYARVARQNARMPVIRLAAGLLLAAFLVHLFGVGYEWWRDQQRIAVIDSELSEVFYGAFGNDARLVDPLAQLEASARTGGSSGTSADLISLLRAAAPVLATESRMRLNGIEFRDGVLELALAAPDVGTLDGLRERLNSVAGLAAELGGTQFGDGEFVGRLRLQGG